MQPVSTGCATGLSGRHSGYYRVVANLCTEILSCFSAHIVIMPPDISVIVLVHKDTRISVFDSHAHGEGGAFMFSSQCPR